MKKKYSILFSFLGGVASYSQVGIGTVLPNTSSQLEVVASDKGVLIPRITLTGLTDAITITNGNVNSLLVFNTATATGITPGYYYWYDNKWNRIAVSGDITPISGTVVYNAVSQQFNYIDSSGSTKLLDFGLTVKANETVTTLVNNGSGSYTYNNEAGFAVNIDVVGDVTSNFTTITNDPAVSNIIKNIVNKTDGNVTYDATTKQFSYVDATGTTQVVDISTIVKANETVTTLVNNGSGSYTYNNEAGVAVNIDVVGDVTSNFTTITNDPAVSDIIKNIVNKTNGNVTYDATTKQFSYVDATGTTQVVDISTIVKANETVTTLVNNGSGSYTYNNEAGVAVNIDVVGDVTSNFTTITNDPAVTNIIKDIVNKTDGNVTYDAITKQFSYVDATGTTQLVDISTIVKANETVTTLVNNGSGSYTYNNEAGVAVNIDVVGDVTSNFTTITNDPAVTNIIKDIVNKTDGNVTYDATTKQFSYVDATGTTQLVDISTIVKANETVTTLVNNGSGSYTYNNEAGVAVNIDVVGDVTSNFTTITNDPAVTNIIKNIVNKTDGNVTYDATTKQFSYVDATGTTQVVDISTIVKANETVTTLVNNGSGSYTYNNEAGVAVNIDVVGDVTSNFTTITNDPAVTNIIKDIVNKTDGNVTYDATTKQFSYVDATGTTQVVDISTIVKANETVTTLVNNGSGSYTYNNEAGVAVNIDVVGDVTSNFTTITNDPAVTNIIKDIVNKTDGNVTYDATTKQFSYVDATGTTQVVDISTIVKANETVTTLVNNGSGSYTYNNEAGVAVNIDVVGDVTSNFTTITNDPAVTNIIKDIVNKTDGNVTYDATTKQFSYVDATGTTQVVDISTIVKANETVTTLVNNGSGSYTYNNEAGVAVNIDVVGDVTSNFTTITNDPAVTNIIKDIVNKTDGNVTYDATTKQFSYVDATGTTQVVDISTIVKANETVTTLVNNGSGSYTYNNEAGVAVNIDVVGDVTSNFTTITNDPAVTNIIKDIVNKTDGNVTYDATTKQFSYVDATGTTQLVDISTIVKANETVTTLVNNGSGSYTYNNEAGVAVNIDVVGDVTSNFTTITNDPAVTNIIKDIVNKTDGNVTYDATTKQFSYVDATGTTQLVDISSIVKANETVTVLAPIVTTGNTIATYTNEAGGTPVDIKETLTSLTDVVTSSTDSSGQLIDVHTLTYTDENNSSNAIDMSVLVKGEETLTSLSYDGAAHSLIYKDEDGIATSFAMTDIIGDSETLTTLAVNPTTGTLDYRDEDMATTQLDLSAAVKEPWYSTATNIGATLNTDNMYTNGWVGIGFTAPSAALNEKLRVNGSITTANSYYADYVFEDYFKGFSKINANYKFKSLTEVEDFIKINKHLPGITPITKLVKTKEGYSFNISELSIQLLEKTEEIYLHIIEQNKEIEAKDKEIDELKEASMLMNSRLEKLEKLLEVKAD